MEINTKLDLMIMQSLAQLINNIIDIFSSDHGQGNPFL